MSLAIIAVGRLDEPTPERAQALAQALGLTVFESRPRVQPPAPRVVATYQDPIDAELAVAALQIAGFAPLQLDGDALADDAGRESVRSFELLPDRLRLTSKTGTEHELPWPAVRLLLAGISTSQQRETMEKKTRKFDLGTAVMSSGLMMTKKKKVRVQTLSESSRAFVEVHAAGHPAYQLWEDELDYQGLGAALQPSRLLNHRRLVQELRERAPAAVYDDRLTTKAGRTRVLGGILPPDQFLPVALALLAAYHDRDEG